MAEKIHNIHDRFMKSMLGDISVARDYFKAFLPENLKKILDLSSIEYSPSSFISDRLQETMADMVFKCPLVGTSSQEELYLCLLFEHRSTPQKTAIISLGGYLFDAYRGQLKSNTEPIIPVIPFLYYHGNQKWKPQRLKNLFDKYPSDILGYLPDFQFIFENIQNYSDEQISQMGQSLLVSSLLTQKHVWEPEKLVDNFHRIFAILNSWDKGNLFDSLIVYYTQSTVIDASKFDKLMDQIPEAMKTEFISLADQWKQQGLQQGLQKGLQQGSIEERDRLNRQATINMIRKGFEDSVICDVLDVTPEYVRSIRQEILGADE